MMSRRNKVWLNGIMGVIVGDALGLPVQFEAREVFKNNPVTDMIGYGTFYLPAGSWSDDGSLTLATLASIRETGDINCHDIMERFVAWLFKGEYTPFGESFDQGATCIRAIKNFKNGCDPDECGVRGEYANGNGALMRIMPVCLFAYENEKAGEWTNEQAVAIVHKVSALTHNHLRSQMACGIYYFLVRNILDGEGTLMERLQKGIDDAVAFYHDSPENLEQLAYFKRLLDLDRFQRTSENEIASGGYVLDSIEAAVWCLLNTNNYEDCMLMAVNLGHDTDTTAAIAGGLAGLYYGYENIPVSWLDKIQRREWIEEMCRL